MKRVLMTGASGFVGANLARRLLQNGHELTLMLREGHRTWRLDSIRSECCVVIGDVTDADKVAETVAAIRPEWVFHLAAYGAYSTQTGLERMIATNLMGCSALLNACIRSEVEVFVQTGSSSEYGYKNSASRETDVLEPNSHYAITKAAATHLCCFTAHSSGLRATTLRLYSAYGPFEEPTRFIPALLIGCLTGKLPRLASPRTSRDFVFIEDVVDALLLAAETPHIPPGAIFNVATGIQSTLSMVVKEARTLLHVEIEPEWDTIQSRSWDTDIWLGDSSAIQNQLGWRPKVRLREGVTRTVDWLLSNPRLLSFYKSGAQ